MARMFASLSVPNYRRYFSGVLASNIGSWMSRTAASWLVLVELTPGDMSAIGLLTGLMFLPALLLSPYAGTLADRIPKRRLMIGAQCVMLVDSALLGVLIITGNIQLWQVFVITFIDGCAGAVDAPARQAFVSELVPKDLLSNAIGLNSANFNAARLFGPGIAGLLIALIGTGPVFLVNTSTFVVLLWATISLDASALLVSDAPPRGKGGLKDALRYVRRRPDLMLLLFVGFMMGNFAFNFAISNPSMAKIEFGKGPPEFGMLGSLMGVGALGAALLSAARKRPRLRYILVAMLGFALFQAASGAAPEFWMFAALQVPIGLCAITAVVTANTLLQTSVAGAVRGRVMALWMVFLLGGAPVISPLVGWVGTAFGPRATVYFGAVAIALTFAAVLGYLMAHDRARLRLQWSATRPIVVYYAPGDAQVDRA